MTVASLWKALDRAGCGKQVGAKELQDHLQLKKKTNPWNFCEMEKLSQSMENHPVLAVDLSIWICEALTSSAMQQNHVVDPSLQLVYCRTLKLLNLGIKLVVVIEGKRRIRRGMSDYNNKNDDCNEKTVGEDTFRKRRSGARFWTACERCEEMLKLLGVTVVRAKAEGEALCALLSTRGIVDGVISNDGDCLLFGAKVLYTKFSVENLDKCNVTRYDASNIRAVVDDDDADEYDETGQKSKEGQDVVKLSRSDLIAFAILTGSDLAGDGISTVGCRKAIRFIRKCQIDNPLKIDGSFSPSLEQLISWEETDSCIGNSGKDVPGPRCSCCGHLGTKKTHKKNGCEGCGTQPGESCFQLSPGGRFRKSLRAKALEMRSNFDPTSTDRAYHEPNKNQVPHCLLGKTARTLKMHSPQLEKILQSSFIIRGHSLQESREFIKKSLSAYLARQELFVQMSGSTKENNSIKLSRNHNRPIPIRVNKLLVRAGKPSCEVKWIVKATMSDTEGNPMDQYEFLTIEEECVIQKCYPKLIQSFQEEEQKLKQQGTAEQEKRRAFLIGLEATVQEGAVQVDGRKKSSARKDYFDKGQVVDKAPAKLNGISDDVKNILIQITKKRKKDNNKIISKNDEYDAPFREIICTTTNDLYETPKQQHICRNDDAKMILGNRDINEQINDDSSTIKTRTLTSQDSIEEKLSSINSQDYFRDSLTPGHIHYLGIRSIPERDQKRHIMREEDRQTRMITKAKEVQIKLLKPARSDRIVRKNTPYDQYQRTYLRKEDLKSKSRILISNVKNQEHGSNGSSCIEHGRSEKLQERSFLEPFHAKESIVGGCFPTTDQPYPTIDNRQISPSRSPLVKRRKDKLKGRNYTHFDEYLYKNREILAETVHKNKLREKKNVMNTHHFNLLHNEFDDNIENFGDPLSTKLEMKFDESNQIRKFDRGELNPQLGNPHDEREYIQEHIEYVPNKSSSVAFEEHNHGFHYDESREQEDTIRGIHRRSLRSEENEEKYVYRQKSKLFNQYDSEQSPQNQSKNVNYERTHFVDREGSIYENDEFNSSTAMMMEVSLSVEEHIPLYGESRISKYCGYDMCHRREIIDRSKRNGCCCHESNSSQIYMIQPNLLDNQRGLSRNESEVSYQDYRQSCYYSPANDEIRTDPEITASQSETLNNNFGKESITCEEIEKRVAMKLESRNRRADISYRLKMSETF
mmetsp:Transcript_2992/g.3381  ORF Transcript_2992/g.3381 Transcript_2992/m.3381 type:complete len:1202 (-) Transcript_2992:56-3661(-)